MSLPGRRDLGWNVAVAVLEGVEVPCSKDQGSREVEEEEVGHASLSSRYNGKA
jgi:hypothetical protein